MALDALEQRIVKEVLDRRSVLLGDLRRLVDIPTGPGGDGLDECRGILCARLEALGAATTLAPGQPKEGWLHGRLETGFVPPMALCRRPANVPGARVLLCGHIDTVHEASSPFRGLVSDASLTRAMGPGCADMKGGIVVALHALEVLESLGEPCSWCFAISSDEETGSYHSDATMRSEATAYDVGLVFEPAMADGGLVVERPGSGQFMIEVRGRSSHVGRDFASGVSAVTALGARLVTLGGMSSPAQGKIVNVGPIEGGHATNIVPDRALAWGNVRFPDTQAGEVLGREIDTLGTPEGAMPEVIVRRSFHRPAKPLTPPTLRLAEQARAAAEDLGQSLPFGRTGGVCDGNNLQAAGLPTIDTLGVRGGGLHTTDEWIDLTSLTDRCALAAVLISRLSRQGLKGA